MRRGNIHLAWTRPPAGDRLESAGINADPTVRIRRRNRCKICQQLQPDERVLCSYCLQYVP